MDIIVQDVHKYYGSEHILKGLSFKVYNGEKVGVLGKNGAGKTTLFKILSGMEQYDEGIVNLTGTVAILDQIPEYPYNYTVMDVLRISFKRLFEIKQKMKELEEIMATTSDKSFHPSTIKEYGALQIEFENLGGYTMDSDTAKICNGLRISKGMQNRLFSSLSGGERTRVNLGRIILQNPDTLLLDEPTNHLDINSTEWLEDYLSQYKGTVLTISHDRYFLDNLVQRIIEIVDGKTEFYEGNYSYYIKEKKLRYIQKLQQYDQEQRVIKRLEKAATRMHQWAKSSNNPSLHKRAFAIERRIERMDKTDKPLKEKSIKTVFTETGSSSKDVIVIKELCKSFNSRCIIDNISLTVERGERICLIGDNGCGKTTLLRIIMGEEMPDTGLSEIGTNIKIAFLPQVVTFDNPGLSILDTIRNTFLISEEAARNRLAAYYFKGDDVFKQVATLSGGEKSRLKLCMLMNNDINLLILDEPTNHLDITSREWIEEAINRFDGTLLFVSHDRYLINRFAERVWNMKDGIIFDFKGTYDAYKEWKSLNENSSSNRGNVNKNNNNNSSNSNRLNEIKRAGDKNLNKTIDKKFNKNESRSNRWKSKRDRQITAKLNEIEKSIHNIEDRLRFIGMEIEQKASDYISLEILLKEKSELDLKLECLYTKWDELTEKVIT